MNYELRLRVALEYREGQNHTLQRAPVSSKGETRLLCLQGDNCRGILNNNTESSVNCEI